MTESCFLICPIGEPDSETRRRSDKWVRHVVNPVVVKEFGYEPLRADEMPNSGIITNQVIQALFESSLVIADLTESNPNVFYELALRHACRKPFIQMVHAGGRIPFDLQGVRTIEYNLTDPDKLQTATITLSRYITSIKGGHKVDSPVSMAIAESVFAQDSNAIAVFLEKFWSLESDIEVVSKGIDKLKSGIDDIETTVSSLENTVSSLESDVSSLESKVDGADRSSHNSGDIWRMQRSIDKIQTDLESIKRRLVPE